MSLRRIGILLGKEVISGPKSFIFVWAIVAPVVISLVISLIFGTLSSEKPRLGIVDQGNSQLTVSAAETDAISVRDYGNVSDLRHAVEKGEVDMGIVIPSDFDTVVRQNENISLDAFVWGESSSRNRTILSMTITNLVREISGQPVPFKIESVTLGNDTDIPWKERMLPFIVLMAVFLGGMFLPATSIINEKEKRTLTALLVTPATPEDVFLAKGITGIGLSLLSGVVILMLNQAFGIQPLLLVLVLLLGAIMAAGMGMLMGVVLRNINTLFSVWKLGGILLFGPAFIYMFPQIPQWIGRLFPTYYILKPITEISQRGSGWGGIATEVVILIVLDIVLLAIVALFLRRAKWMAAFD